MNHSSSRRRFLEKLSLGAGAVVLSPVFNSLVADAQGQGLNRKRFIVVTFPNGATFGGGVPPEYATDKTRHGPTLLEVPDFTMPPRFAPLAPYKNRMLIVDGLVNRNGNAGHFAHDLLTCCKNTGQGNPGGKSFDQHVAAQLGKETAFASVHVGSHTGSDGWPGPAPGKLLNTMFAKGAGQPVPMHTDPAEAFSFYFPNGLAAGATAAKPNFSDRRKLLDFLSEDVKRVRMALAGEEKAKLDQYLGALESAQQRITTLEKQAAAGGGVCGSKPATLPVPGAVEADDIFEAQMAIGTAAIACGLTNVLTVSMVGIGRTFFKRLGFTESLHNIGHGKSGAPGLSANQSADKYIEWFSAQTAKMAQTLAGLSEGGKSVLDQSVILFANDNAESHHCSGNRYPVILLGSAGGALKANGRYIRYPTAPDGKVPKVGPAGMRAVGDLMTTLGQALGTPAPGWGSNGGEAVKGPLTELL